MANKASPPGEDTEPRGVGVAAQPGRLVFAVMTIAALVVAIVAAAAALIALRYTRRSARSAETSATAAAKTAALDADRRHAELTPEFDVTCTAGANGIDAIGELRVKLTGPAGLDRLDEVTIVILDEAGADHWAHGYPNGVSEEEARRFVWAPWEFNTGASAQVAGNRTTRPRPYSRADGQNWDRLSLTRTRPGHWMATTQEQWQKQIAGPVRLQITARRGSDQWVLLQEVE